MGNTSYAERVKELAERLSYFFLEFDGLFLYEEESEQLLNDVKKSLEEKISHNESALPIIMAYGGNYDSEIDRAKVEETKALLDLIKARKDLRNATKRQNEKKNNANEVLALFGL